MNIAELNAAIAEARAKIDQYQQLISKVTETVTNLTNGNTNLMKSNELLATGFIVNSRPADGGAISSISLDINNSISKFSNVSSLASKKISQLESDIVSYQKQIERIIEAQRREAELEAQRKENLTGNNRSTVNSSSYSSNSQNKR